MMHQTLRVCSTSHPRDRSSSHVRRISADIFKHTGAEVEARKDALAAGDALIRSQVRLSFPPHLSMQVYFVRDHVFEPSLTDPYAQVLNVLKDMVNTTAATHTDDSSRQAQKVNRKV